MMYNFHILNFTPRSYRWFSICTNNNIHSSHSIAVLGSWNTIKFGYTRNSKTKLL
jgi:hypothetical protein